MGMVTGIGGGMARDVLAGRVPVVFRGELYATPALAGAASRSSAPAWASPSVGRRPRRGRLPGLAAAGHVATLAGADADRSRQRLTVTPPSVTFGLPIGATRNPNVRATGCGADRWVDGEGGSRAARAETRPAAAATR